MVLRTGSPVIYARTLGKRIASSLLVTVGLLLVISSFTGIQAFQDTTAVPKAPDFELTDTDGNTWTLRQFEGKSIVFLDLMAINCASCKIVEANLKRVYPDYKDDVFVISINVWTNVETEEELREYKTEKDIPWPMAMDTDDILTKYNAFEIAKVIIIDDGGFPVYENTGITSEGQMREELDQTLKGRNDRIEISPVSLWTLAIFAGVASFMSPCAFPMFPGYMTYYFSKHIGSKEKRVSPMKAAASGGVAALGIMTIYGGFGALIIILGSFIVPFISSFQLIIGLMLIFLGILMTTDLSFEPLLRPFQRLSRPIGLALRKRIGVGDKAVPSYYSGLYIYGIGYGSCASVCTLPIFLGVILSGIVSGNLVTGFLLLLVYMISAAGLMVILTVALGFAGSVAVKRLSKYTGLIKKLSAIVLLIAGVYLVLFWLVAYGYLDVPF